MDAVKNWRWENGSPFAALLWRRNRELRRAWNWDRILRLCKLGHFTPEELAAFVGVSEDRLQSDRLYIPLVLNLQRLEDYLIHRRIGSRPIISTGDAVMVKMMNRKQEPEKEPAC